MSSADFSSRFPSLFMTDVDVCQRGAFNPLVAQVERVIHADGRELSRDAANYPPVVDALLRTQDMAVAPASGPVASFLLANCGRKRYPPKSRSEAELRRLSLTQAEREGGEKGVANFLRREEEHDFAADVARQGGSPIETVILYEIEGVGNQEFLVSLDWTPRRVAELVGRAFRVHQCFFCPAHSQIRLDIYLLVRCGGVTKMLACCDTCAWKFKTEMQGGLTFLHAWDPELFLAGFPDDWYWL